MTVNGERSPVVTGMGIVTGAGNGISEVWRALKASCAAPRLLRAPGTGALACCVEGLDETTVDRRPARDADRLTLLALAAARQAAGDAAFAPGQDPCRRAVVLGTGFGPIATVSAHVAQAALQPDARVSPAAIPNGMHGSTAFHVARLVGAQGPSVTVSTACSSGAAAVALGCQMIRLGQADQVLVCGADAPLTRDVLRAWQAMRVLSTRPAEQRPFRPFDAHRDGFVLGEGAAAVVLEPRAFAARRGAGIHCEIAGVAATCDTSSLTRPSPEPQALAMITALAEAGIAPDELALVNAHGTATRWNDPTEAAAVRRALGRSWPDVPVQASKPLFGHTMGASGVIELVLCVMQLLRGELHPTPHLADVDPECDLFHLKEWRPAGDRPCFISNSFGFGGNNVVIAGRVPRDGRGRYT